MNKKQLESFNQFIWQASIYSESKNQALCCGSENHKAGADIVPVIKSVQPNSKETHKA